MHNYNMSYQLSKRALTLTLCLLFLLIAKATAVTTVESYTGGAEGVGGTIDISKLRCALSITDANCESVLFPTATIPHANRPALVMLYSPQCTHCQELMPHFDAIGYEALYGKGFGTLRLPENATTSTPPQAMYSPSSPNPYGPQFAIANMAENIRLRDVFPAKSLPSFVYTLGGHAYPYQGAISAEGFAKAAAMLTEAHFYSNLVTPTSASTPILSSPVPDISTFETFKPFWKDLTSYNRYTNPMGSQKTDDGDNEEKTNIKQPLSTPTESEDGPVNLGIVPPLFVVCLPPDSDTLYKPNKDLLEQAPQGAHPIVRPAFATFLSSVLTAGRARFATLKASSSPRKETNKEAATEKKFLTDYEPSSAEIFTILSKGCDSAFAPSTARKPSQGPNGEVLMMYSADRSSNPIFYHGASDGVSNLVSKKRWSGEGVADIVEQMTKVPSSKNGGGNDANVEETTSIKTVLTNVPNSNEAAHITTRIEPLISVIGAPTYRTSKATALWIWENSYNLVEYGSSDVLSALPKRVQLGVFVMDDSKPSATPYSTASHPYYPGLNWLSRKRYQAYRTLHRGYYERGVALETFVKEGRWPIPSPPSVPMISLAQCDFDSAGWMVRWHTISPMQIIVVTANAHKAWLERVVGLNAVTRAASEKAYPYFFAYDAMANKMALMADWLAEGRKDTLQVTASENGELPEGFEPKSGIAVHLIDQFMNDFINVPNAKNDNTPVEGSNKKKKEKESAQSSKATKTETKTKPSKADPPSKKESNKKPEGSEKLADDSKKGQTIPTATKSASTSSKATDSTSSVISDDDIPSVQVPATSQTTTDSATPSRIKIVHLSKSAQFVAYIVEVFPIADKLLRWCGDDSMLFVIVSAIASFFIAALVASLFGASQRAEEEEVGGAKKSSIKQSKRVDTKSAANSDAPLSS